MRISSSLPTFGSTGICTVGVGGSPLLWQHLFCGSTHIQLVYIMILPAMGIVSEVIATHSRKPVFGYVPMVIAIIAICGLGFIVWGHHCVYQHMNPVLGTALSCRLLLIAVPIRPIIKVFNWLGTMVEEEFS